MLRAFLLNVTGAVVPLGILAGLFFVLSACFLAALLYTRARNSHSKDAELKEALTEAQKEEPCEGKAFSSKDTELIKRCKELEEELRECEEQNKRYRVAIVDYRTHLATVVRMLAEARVGQNAQFFKDVNERVIETVMDRLSRNEQEN